MITIKTQVGKFYFTDYVQLASNQSAQVDETSLSVGQLKDLLKAVDYKRIVVSDSDVLLVRAALEAQSNTGGGSIDPSVLAAKEDKVNKVKLLGTGSDTQYPTTSAIISYISGSDFITSSFLVSYALKTDVNLKADKTELSKYMLKTDVVPGGKPVTASATLGNTIVVNDLAGSTELFVPPPVKDIVVTNTLTHNVVNSVPMYTLNNSGTYVLCTPDFWVQLGDDLYVPGYKKESAWTEV